MKNTIGVIVARFQVPELHAGHKYLLDQAMSQHSNVLVVLGVARTRATAHDPLSYEMRVGMLLNQYPTVRVVSLRDSRSDKLWSEALDALIAREYPRADALLYCSRDSFATYYRGKNTIVEIKPIPEVSGEKVRNGKLHSIPSADFRHGMIYSVNNRPGQVYQAVDIAIMRGDTVLLGSKEEDAGKPRFVGGHVDTTDPSLEFAAARECAEETGSIGIGELTYVGSVQVDDWRYRNTKDRIMTTLFQTQFMFGKPVASDDLDTLTWVPLAELKNLLVTEHLPLADLLLAKLKK